MIQNGGFKDEIKTTLGGVDAVASDYYLSGVKAEPDHYGCAANLG